METLFAIPACHFGFRATAQAGSFLTFTALPALIGCDFRQPS
jgi:hypothetical protein